MDIAIFDIVEADEVSASIQAAGRGALTVTGDVTEPEDRLRAFCEVRDEIERRLKVYFVK